MLRVEFGNWQFKAPIWLANNKAYAVRRWSNNVLHGICLTDDPKTLFEVISTEDVHDLIAWAYTYELVINDHELTDEEMAVMDRAVLMGEKYEFQFTKLVEINLLPSRRLGK